MAPRLALAPMLVVGLSMLSLVAGLDIVKTMTFSLTLRVNKDEWEATHAETAKLLAFARENKMGTNTMQLVRTAADKVDKVYKDIQKAIDEEKVELAKKKTQEAPPPPPPAVFISKQMGVKPLKKAVASKKNNVKRYTVAKIGELLKARKVDFTMPFIVTDGVSQLQELRANWTAERLVEMDHVKLHYISPQVAKKKRTYEQKQPGEQEAQGDYHEISFEKYFRNCFNLLAKADFRKIPGSGTEHCEQSINAFSLDPAVSGYRLEAIQAQLGWLQLLETGRAEFASHKKDLEPLITAGADVTSVLGAGNSRFFTLGPSGAGEQLRQDSKNVVDGLIYGHRRWFFMAPEQFNTLRQNAKEVMEPASAFMFFEQQFGELQEDFGLGRREMKFWECNQKPGDLIYVPGHLIHTSLNLEDSFSYMQHVANSKSAVLGNLNDNMWAPNSGAIPAAYRAAACTGYDFEPLSKLGPPMQNPMYAQIFPQILRQTHGTVQAQNELILGLLSECSALLAAPQLNAAKTYCGALWGPCTARLAKNADSLKAKYPTWLPRDIKVVDNGDADDAIEEKQGEVAGGDEAPSEPEPTKKKKKKKGKKKKRSKKEL